MDGAPTSTVRTGLGGLPNELLLVVLNSLHTRDILSITSLSRRFHALCFRLLQNRLAIAAELSQQMLWLEASHPYDRRWDRGLHCTLLGTEGLHDEHDPDVEVGRIRHLGSRYSRFRPFRRESAPAIARPGDIPGSRTYPSSNSLGMQCDDAEMQLAGETVSLDAHELFAQLQIIANMAKPGQFGLLLGNVGVTEGQVRVWRHWLAQQACTRDEELKDGPRQNSRLFAEPADDPSILFVNKDNNAVGVKFRVRSETPEKCDAEDEIAVSYYLEFEELLIRTSHLLFKIEELLQLSNNGPRGTILFGRNL